ncbi:hypothetical protein FOBRF1_000710 [Fusarium oxysporum]
MSRPWPLVCASLSFLRSRFCLPPFLFLDKDDRPFPPKVQWPLFTLRLIHLIIVMLYEMKSLVFTAPCCTPNSLVEPQMIHADHHHTNLGLLWNDSPLVTASSTTSVPGTLGKSHLTLLHYSMAICNGFYYVIQWNSLGSDHTTGQGHKECWGDGSSRGAEVV